MIVATFLGALPTVAGSAEPRDERAVEVSPSHDGIGSGAIPLEQAIRDGKVLFKTKFNVLDGAGRPMATGDSKPTPRYIRVDNPFQRIAGPDASACSSCHNEPTIGGSGDSVTNTFVGAHFSDPPTASTTARDTNERNTVTLFGSGLLERLATEMTEELHRIRDQALVQAAQEHRETAASLRTKGVEYGQLVAYPDGYVDYRNVEGIDYDLVVKPFGIKGIIISLREFAIAALNQHHGIQAVERFGWERTGTKDFDVDGVENEFSFGQVTAMVLFQAALPPPPQAWSRDPDLNASEKRGEMLFREIRCAGCHLPEIALTSPKFTEPNRFNRPGTLTPKYTHNVIELDLTLYADKNSDGYYIVHPFTDFKRHVMCDNEVRTLCNEERKQDNVAVDKFLTQKLWDLATSAPYCHRGDCSTLGEAILAHGGEGRASRDAFVNLDEQDKHALISYLKTLGRGMEYQAIFQ